MEDVTNKKITILGAARSGLAAAALLKQKGARPFVSDSAPVEQKEEQKRFLEERDIPFEFGGHSDRVFEAEFVVLSPGIPVRSQVVQRLIKKGIPVWSEIEVAFWFCAAKLIAVTGSNGKTTTTTLIGEMLRRKYPGAIVAGNIGQPLSDFVLNSRPEEWGVVEVSSFQLETIRRFHPAQAVVLNFAPNHLDRYDSYEDYIAAKWRVTMNLSPQDVLIYNAMDEVLRAKAQNTPAVKQGFSSEPQPGQAAWFEQGKIYLGDEMLIDVRGMKLRGAHNYENAMAAALAARNAGVPCEDIRQVLREFKGIEHRLEFVANKKGVRFINDSKATTVESLTVALKSFDQPVVLIAGGKDKGSDFTKLNPLIAQKVKHLVLIGQAADKMERAWQGIKPLSKPQTFREAVQLAYSLADEGEVVLLSPACASFDMFKDYEERGRIFKQIVRELDES